MAATIVNGSVWKLSADNDTIPGRVCVTAIYAQTGAGSAMVMKTGGTGGEAMFTLTTPANSFYPLYQPSTPSDFQDLFLTTAGTNIIYVFLARTS